MDGYRRCLAKVPVRGAQGCGLAWRSHRYPGHPSPKSRESTHEPGSKHSNRQEDGRSHQHRQAGTVPRHFRVRRSRPRPGARPGQRTGRFHQVFHAVPLSVSRPENRCRAHGRGRGQCRHRLHRHRHAGRPVPGHTRHGQEDQGTRHADRQVQQRRQDHRALGQFGRGWDSTADRGNQADFEPGSAACADGRYRLVISGLQH